MKQRGESVFSFLVDAIFPRFCVSCHREGTLLCTACERSWNDVPIRMIGRRHVSAFAYADPMARSLLCAWKYAYDGSAWGILQRRLMTSEAVLRAFIQAVRIDTITYVPLHPVKLCQRGFDQAEEIAHWIGSIVDRPVDSLLQRVRYTKTQASKPVANRRLLTKHNPFTASSTDAKRVLLVDDVWTTGSTMRCAARALRQAGAEVWYYTLAKG